MKNLLLALLVPLLIFAAPKALHLTFHKGCGGEISYICKSLGIELDTWYLLDQKEEALNNISGGIANYIMDHDKAKRIFNKHKETFEKYDLIITSDIAPLSRIFLQNNWKKPLIIWVCNRFDMNPFQSGVHIFPDSEYLHLFEEAGNLPNVEIIGYTKYEAVHAQIHRDITSIKKTIPPTGNGVLPKFTKGVPKKVDKKNTFFLRPYRNEYITRLVSILKGEGIKTYIGPYAGSADLADFKGMIHIPLVMSNFHLWENLSKGIVHFIPSKAFYSTLYNARKIEFWDWTNPSKKQKNLSIREIIANCDWYDDKLAPLFVFFDSFDELKILTEETNYMAKKALIKAFHKEHTERCLSSWKKSFTKFITLPSPS